MLFLTCEGTSFLRIKPLDELVEEQLEDGLTLFFEFFRIMYQSTLNSCFFCFELADMIFSFPTTWQQNNFLILLQQIFLSFFYISLNSFLFIFWNCFLPIFPSSLKGVLYTSSIAPLIIFGATHSVSAPPDRTT